MILLVSVRADVLLVLLAILVTFLIALEMTLELFLMIVHCETLNLCQQSRAFSFMSCALIRTLMACTLLLLLLFGVRCARPGESENTLSVQRPQLHTTNPWKEEEEDKIVGDTKERSVHANTKALALLLKPASPTPSNTGSLRSFQRDTKRGTKVLRY